MPKKVFKKKSAPAGDMSLNITAMADIFVVLLVFLLKSFSTSAINLTPTAGLTLPQAFAASQNPIEALKVEISKEAVLIEDQPVAELKEFRFQKGDLNQNKSSKSLAKALKKERKRQLTIAKANSSVKVDSKIIIVADQKAPYSTVKTVLASAALNGYTDFKLAVVAGD